METNSNFKKTSVGRASSIAHSENTRKRLFFLIAFIMLIAEHVAISAAAVLIKMCKVTIGVRNIKNGAFFNLH